VEGGEKPDGNIVRLFAVNNCRLLSFHASAGEGNAYNDFVLRSTAIIEGYAKQMLRTKRAYTIYTDRLCDIR
jgi:hypothetical protein